MDWEAKNIIISKWEAKHIITSIEKKHHMGIKIRKLKKKLTIEKTQH